jgi:two-component system OmpR family sensor kinase
MTLRTRLAVGAAIILAVAVGAVGVVLSQTARSALISPIDERLTRIADGVTRGPRFDGGPRGPNLGGPFDSGSTTGRQNRPEGRDTALLRFVDGKLDMSEPSGFDTDPDALPVVDPSVLANLSPGDSKLVDLQSANGGLDFRAILIASETSTSTGTSTTKLTSSAGAADQRVVYVFAQPLASVDATVRRLQLTALLAALGALVVGAGLTWWSVRRSLQPVEATVEIAGRIGDGDLSLRVPEPERPSELHRLGHSINAMLTNLEASQDAERSARAALTQFVADASHELRTPIAAISGHAELIESHALDSQGADRSASRIAAESHRMQRLVDDLLTLASHDAGQRRAHRVVNLSDVVSDALEDARAIDATRRYEGFADPGVRVNGDEAQLIQILSNLLGNVRVHTPPGTATRVELHASDGVAVLRVSDDGPGISVEQQSRLFERFFRADSSRSRTTGGAGLGLAIVAALVEDHAGEISVQSETGRGTTFELRLPIAS